MIFGDQFCHKPRAGAVDELVDSVLHDVIVLFLSIPPLYNYEPDGVREACKIADAEARRRAAADKALADPEFLRAFLPRLAGALKAKKMTCVDCPTVPVRMLRPVSWSDISLYFTSVVFPHLRTGNDGQLHASFRICSGPEAAANFPSPDIGLLRAGLFLAQRAEVVREVAADEMGKAMAEPGFGTLGSDAERRGYLKQRISERLTTDAGVRIAVCQLLTEYQLALGLDVPECRSTKP